MASPSWIVVDYSRSKEQKKSPEVFKKYLPNTLKHILENVFKNSSFIGAERILCALRKIFSKE